MHTGFQTQTPKKKNTQCGNAKLLLKARTMNKQKQRKREPTAQKGERERERARYVRAIKPFGID
jgi:hypothetical protein